MKKIALICGLIAISYGLGGQEAIKAQSAVNPGGAFRARPAPGWAGVVQNLYPVVHSQAMGYPRLIPLQTALGEITLRLSENELAGLKSMEFVRFMPKTYQKKPEAFAKLDEERQITSLLRGVRAATRELDSEATELTEKVSAGKATIEDAQRLAEILTNNFYLSFPVRQDVEQNLAGALSGASNTDPIHPALGKLKELVERPFHQGAVFDSAEGSFLSETDETPAVSVPASYAARGKRQGPNPNHAISKNKGELMKTNAKKAISKRSVPSPLSSGPVKGLPQQKAVRRLIEALDLQPLPGEGGYYKETYRSGIKIPVPLKDGEQPVSRHLGTAIYYFVTPQEFSALHKLKSDEVFHFYGGDPVEMIQISETGEVKTIILGPDVLKGQQVQVVVSAGTWQGTRLIKGGEYALMGTTVFPAFEFADFELGKRAELVARFPRLMAQIKKFTRE